MEYVLLQVEIANLDITLLISEIQILYAHNVQMHNVLSVHKRTNVANVLWPTNYKELVIVLKYV